MSSTSTRAGKGGGPRPPIDPRIRARRIEVLRDTGRRRLRRLVVGLVVVAAVLAAWAISRSPLLDVDRLRVTGASRTGRAAVLEATGVERGDPLLWLDVGRVAADLRALPWVADATVRRTWPGTVGIVVEEHVPVAAVRTAAPEGDGAPAGGEEGAEEEEGDGDAAQEGGRSRYSWVLVSAQGHQLERAGERPGGIPEVVGLRVRQRPGAVVSGAARAVRIVNLAPDPLRERIRRIRVDDDGDLEVVVTLPDDGGEVVGLIGPPDDLARKLVSLTTVLDQVDPSGLEEIDVRVPGSPVLTRAEEAG